MISDYDFQNLVTHLKIQSDALVQSTHANLLQSALLQLNDEDKIKLKNAYIEGVIVKFKSGSLKYEDKLIEVLIKSFIVDDLIKERSEDIKLFLFEKIKTIIENINRNEFYALKDQIQNLLVNYVKNSINEILMGSNKAIIDNALKVITTTFVNISIKDHADKLFNKAQSIINEDIIKDIIE